MTRRLTWVTMGMSRVDLGDSGVVVASEGLLEPVRLKSSATPSESVKRLSSESPVPLVKRMVLGFTGVIRGSCLMAAEATTTVPWGQARVLLVNAPDPDRPWKKRPGG